MLDTTLLFCPNTMEISPGLGMRHMRYKKIIFQAERLVIWIFGEL